METIEKDLNYVSVKMDDRHSMLNFCHYNVADSPTARTSVAVIYQGHIPARYSKLGHKSSSRWGSRVIIGGEILFDFK